MVSSNVAGVVHFNAPNKIKQTKKSPNGLFFNGGNDEACLGFPPCSESFAYEPSVQVSSISSLSGLATLLRRPSANPLEHDKVLTHLAFSSLG